MTPGVELTALGALAAILIALAIYIALRVHGTPEKRERKRRLYVNKSGRLGDAMITETADNVLYYTYSVHGVQYAASQDITTLRDLLSGDPERRIGPAHIKYMIKNPANSILICEEWSGLRKRADTAPPLPDLNRVGHQA